MITNVNMDAKQVSQPDPGWKIPKMDGPAPGSYDMAKSFDSTQRRRPHGTAEQKSRRIDFTEAYSKLRKYVPGQGTYPDAWKGLSLQSKPRQLST